MELKSRIRSLADDLIDAVRADGHCDFVSAIAEPLPVTVFLELMGLPVAQLGKFREIVHTYLAPRDLNDPLEFLYRNRMIIDSVKETMLARRDDRRDDILSALWARTVDGEPVTYELMEDYVVLLFVAGLDTVVNGLSYTIRHLAQDQELQALLRAKPELIVDANEEALRRYGFLFIQRRWRVTRNSWGSPCAPGKKWWSPWPRPISIHAVRRSAALRSGPRGQGPHHFRRRPPPLSGIAPRPRRTANSRRAIARPAAAVPARPRPAGKIPFGPHRWRGFAAHRLGSLTPFLRFRG